MKSLCIFIYLNNFDVLVKLTVVSPVTSRYCRDGIIDCVLAGNDKTEKICGS